MLNFMIITISFIVSTFLSLFVMRNRKNKWLAVLSAFASNMTILGLFYWLMYSLNDEWRLFGIDFHNRSVLVIFIPIVTWINGIILSLKRTQ